MKRPRISSRPPKTGSTQHPATKQVSRRYAARVKLGLLEAYPRFGFHRTGASERKRGPDGIRTRICDRREVLCSHYTTGPGRLYTLGLWNKLRWSHVRRILARNGRATDALSRGRGRPRHMAKSCLPLLSARPKTPPVGCPRGRCASCASCLPSAFRAACVCA
jgi:hypothetical protein